MFCDQLKNGLSELKNCQRGGVAVVAGLAMTALVLAAGIAVDYGQAASKRA